LSEAPLVKFTATAKASPDRELNAGDDRARTGSISKLCRVLGLAFVFMLYASPHHANAGESKTLRWLFAGRGAAAIASNADSSRLLDGARPFVMRSRALGEVPPGWQAVPLRSFKSFDEIRTAVEADALSHEVKGVLYDYEKWRFTPAEEQQNPVRYVKQAADLVHARGLLFVTAPAVDLVPILAPESDRRRQDDTYLQLGLAGDAARYADVFDIQSQRFERDTERYANFVRAAAAQARQANPKVLVLAGVSTQPGGHEVTADDILRAIQATRDFVDGYWFNIPEPSEYSPAVTEFRPDIAFDVLLSLGKDEGWTVLA
jgi:hypothetical protein